MKKTIIIDPETVSVDGVIYKKSKEQLKSKCSQKEFNKKFLELLELGKQNVNFIDGTHRFELCDADGDWLFDINYDPDNRHFWYSYYRVYLVFIEQFDLDYDEIQTLMGGVVDSVLKLEGITPTTETTYTYDWWIQY